MHKKAWFALLAALMLTPAASAQLGEVNVDIDGALAGALDPQGSTDVNFTLHVGCDILLEEGGSATFTVSTDLPAEFGAESKDVDVSADQDCLLGGSGDREVSDTLTITPVDGAMGNNKTTFTLTATGAGESGEAENSDQVWIGYLPGHELDPEIEFPYTMTAADGPELVFNVTVTITANSNTMVMFEQADATPGDVTGLAHEVFNLKTGDARERTKTVTFIPPADDWENATISFFNFSHCLDSGFECGNEMEQDISWTITNGGVSTDSGGNGGGEDSPSPGVFTLLLGLLGAAFIAARRR